MKELLIFTILSNIYLEIISVIVLYRFNVFTILEHRTIYWILMRTGTHWHYHIMQHHQGTWCVHELLYCSSIIQCHRWTVYYTFIRSNTFNVLTTCNARFNRALNPHSHSRIPIVFATVYVWLQYPHGWVFDIVMWLLHASNWASSPSVISELNVLSYVLADAPASFDCWRTSCFFMAMTAL